MSCIPSVISSPWPGQRESGAVAPSPPCSWQGSVFGFSGAANGAVTACCTVLQHLLAVSHSQAAELPVGGLVLLAPQ